MRFTRRLSVTVLAVLVLCLGVARTSIAQVLDQVPAEALVVMKVTNLQATSDKFAKLCTELGVAQLAPPMADPLGSLQAHLKITNGLDKAGDVAFAFLDPAVVGGDEEKAMLMLWPVSDFKAFIANFGEPKDEDGLAVVKFGDNPQDWYATEWGKYAALSPSKEVVKMKPTGLKPQGPAAKELTKDFAVWANMPKIREIAQPKLKENREKIVADLENQITQDPEAAKFGPVVKAVVNRLLDVADQFLAETNAAVYSVNLLEGGISTAVVADFTDGSALGNGVKGLKNTSEPLLVGLPENKYLVFGGGVSDPETSVKVISSLGDPIVKDVTAANAEQGAAVAKYVGELKSYYGALKGQTAGLVAPTGQLGQEPIIQMIAIQSGDPAALKTAYVDMVKGQAELMKAFGGEKPAEAATPATKPESKLIDGVTFTVTSMPVESMAGPGGQMQQQMMQWMYGPSGMTFLTGQVDDKIVLGMGATEATLSAAIKAVKAGENPMGSAAAVKTVSAQLPKSRLAEFYVPLDQVVTTIANAAGAMGMNVQMQLPPDLPPIAGAVSSEATTIRLETYTPTELVKALVAAGMQTYMQMQGGRQPGGPGGL